MSNDDNGESSTELLRFITCGSVDDGKSTLIGRMLYDTKLLLDDQIEALKVRSQESGEDHLDLASLTDGLRAEREQGITIDVAYRYFETVHRKFIVADTPGHVQYTRNMVTGASTANLAVILVDARKGVIEQTRRHSYIASLLGIQHLIICVNKMDLVDYSEEIYSKIHQDFEAFSSLIDIQDVTFVPVSALLGDNVVTLSERTPWYNGPPLMSVLENVHIASDRNLQDPRFPVQYVIRPRSDAYHDFRGYAGQVASGIFKIGDSIVVLPSGKRSRIKDIRLFNESREVAYPPMSVTVLLDDDLDISRGDVIVSEDNMTHVGKEFDAMVCWMADRPLRERGRYLIKHGTRTVRAVVQGLKYRVDIQTLDKEKGAEALALNEIGKVSFRTQQPLMYDDYRRNRNTGSFIIIDEADFGTVGAGVIRAPSPPPPLPEYPEYVI